MQWEAFGIWEWNGLRRIALACKRGNTDPGKAFNHIGTSLYIHSHCSINVEITLTCALPLVCEGIRDLPILQQVLRDLEPAETS